MSESTLNVIALISGGKDSFFSLLHCLHHGHQIVALANLYPAPSASKENVGVGGTAQGEADIDEEHDLNSFMYQTVGHTVIPLYEQALGIPLYRQPITGTAVQSGASYDHVESGVEDETESLVPLLERILKDHPTANAISTGAILSTYQRTRVESVALRLGLTPLSFLWKYPILPPGTQASLLEDMQALNLDARIIKVASGGLDEGFLWNNVASLADRTRIERSIKRFGTDGDGAVLGEGGEFETLVIDGPSSVFKGRIEISDDDRIVVREGGGAAWLQIPKAVVFMKEHVDSSAASPRIPDLLDSNFSKILESLGSSLQSVKLHPVPNKGVPIKLDVRANPHSLYWTVSPEQTTSIGSISHQTSNVVGQIQQHLDRNNLPATAITCTTILLRSMADFATINKIYSNLFTAPNPPSRVTISTGDLLPQNTSLIIHLQIACPSPTFSSREALHVQSRSYWAPANIGPYSQAISLPATQEIEYSQRVVSIAGQIPLIPGTMVLPPPSKDEPRDFNLQITLSLQHLQRVGLEMDVQYFTSAIAYVPSSTSLSHDLLPNMPAKAWSLFHQKPKDDDSDDEGEEIDLWESKHYSGMEQRGTSTSQKLLPDFSILSSSSSQTIPPLFIAMVDELPRQAGIEWHAHTGVSGGTMNFHATTRKDGWETYQCSFSGRLRSIVSVLFFEDWNMVGETLGGALKELGLGVDGERKAYTSYYDTSLKEGWEKKSLAGVIPCSKLWNGEGRRLGAVLLFDTLMNDN